MVSPPVRINEIPTSKMRIYVRPRSPSVCKNGKLAELTSGKLKIHFDSRSERRRRRGLEVLK